MDTVILNTSLGDVKAEAYDEYLFFKGIPYAVTKRFEDPVLIDSFEGGFFDATKKEKDCYQKNSFMDDSDDFYTKEFRDGETYEFTEDYMALNILAPKDAEKLPVLLFVHGGGFETGNIGETPYGYTDEYVKHGIIYVSIGYRLNVFGFYGGVNYGLHDQAAAFQWVYKYISEFGGDPERITVMGQSAGAMSLMNQLCSDSLKGIAKGVIMMSGGGTIPKIVKQFTVEESKPFWNIVREKTGAKTDEELKKVDPETLWKAWYEVSRSKDAKMGNKQPGMDGIIPVCQQSDYVKAGKMIDVPMMVGVTSQDMFPFMIYDMALSLGLTAEKKGHQGIYGYYFDRTLPGNLYKAYHAADLWYMFGNMDKCWRPFEEIDFKLKDEMISEVAAFVKTGKPKDENWTPISKSDRSFRLFDGEHKMNVKPSFCRKKLYKTIFKDKGPL